MRGTLTRLGWLALILLAAGTAAATAGLIKVGSVTDGGYATSTVGAPAYAALFVSEVQGRLWLAAGTLLVTVGGLATLFAGPARATGRDGPSASLRGRIITALVLAGLIALLVGVLRFPLGEEQIGGPVLGRERPTFDVTPPGAEWVLGGALCAAVGAILSVVVSRQRQAD